MKIHKLVIPLVIIFNINAFAQPEADSLFDLSIDELLKIKVVSASKKLQTVSDAPSIISSISRTEIHKIGVNSLIDVLKNIPAIETSMGVNGDYRVSIRGVRKDGNILVMLDGLPINDFYDGKPIFDLPVEFIERIEVIRGPGSALFGTNAVAGVINIITCKEYKEATFWGGTNTSYGANINYFVKNENDNFSLSTGYNSTNGANVEPRSTELTGKKTNRWLKDFYINTQFSTKKFNITLFGIIRNQGSWVGPLFDLSPDSDFKNRQLFFNTSYTFDLSHKLSIIPRSYTNIFYHNYLMQEHRADTIIGSSLFVDGAFTNEKYQSVISGTEISVKYLVNENFSLLGGALYEHFNMLNYEIEKNYRQVGFVYLGYFGNHDNLELNQKNKTRDVYAGFFQTDYYWHNIGITAGVRYDKYSDFGYSFNPRAGFIYKIQNIPTLLLQPFHQINFKLLYGRAFRAPTFKELYDKTNVNDGIAGSRGNPKLNPETFSSTEASIELVNKNFIFRTNTYYIVSEDIIGIYDPYGTGDAGDYENMGNTISRGVEVETNIVINPQHLSLFANLSYFQSIFRWRTDIYEFGRHNAYLDSYEGSGIIHNIPRWRANLGFYTSISKFSAYFGINYGSESSTNQRFVMENRNVKIPSYTQGNFSVTYNIKKYFSMSIHADNLGKSKYSDPDESTAIHLLGKSGMGQPASTFMLKINYKF